MQTPEPLVARCRLFLEPKWLGFRHSGYEVKPLNDYILTRNLPDATDNGKDSQARLKELAASYQSLLTFGLVEAVTETGVQEDELLRKYDDGMVVLTMNCFTEIIQKWLARIRRTELESRRQWLKRGQVSLAQAHSLMMTLVLKRFIVFEPLGDHQQAMVIFIALVCETLSSAMKTVHCDRQPPPGLSWSMVWTDDYRQELRKTMAQSKWCPFITEYLLNSKSVSTLKYASQHTPPVDGKDHCKCQRKQCAAYQVDENTYTQRHVEFCESLQELSSSGCTYAKPDFVQVVQHISHTEVPGVRAIHGHDGSAMSLEVLKASDTTYVAISHVWADGLGSNTETGLPTCQLTRLSALASRIHSDGIFWIDSLCIPKDPEPRREAIKMMARTYREAKAVLVLDNGLQRCSSSESEATKLLRVLTSGWMRRLWTLQEAILAKKVFFLLADALVPLEDLVPKSPKLELYPHLEDMAAEVFRLIKQTQYAGYKIGDVSRSLRWRDTSRASDETLAIASLLGIGPDVLLELQPQGRVIKLLQELRSIPKNIVFLTGAKADVPGFRWAPKSFMGAHGGSQGGLELSTFENDGICTPVGLEARYVAFWFSKQTYETYRIRNKSTNATCC
ncbi:hypothetical protein FVER53590_04301 [Fusarium verticillioides]|nr:hypothetical protein FVER53590_04301 [Fusarium verticillioides]